MRPDWIDVEEHEDAPVGCGVWAAIVLLAVLCWVIIGVVVYVANS